MMHYEQYVVAITDSHGKSFREFDSERLSNGRKSKVYLPFDSEYKIKVKNNSDRRIKLSIDIDGTLVSGNGLILNAFDTDSIERFVDVAKKFKFVRKTDERVSDPSSSETGILKIKIEKEVSMWFNQRVHTFPPIIPNHTNIWGQPVIGGGFPSDYTNYGYPYGGRTPNDFTYTSLNASFNSSSPTVQYKGAVDRVVPIKTLLNEEVGATVEGSQSKQQFDTTIWNGTEGESYEFVFKLLAQNGLSDSDRQDYEKYLELKKRFES
jgi:hypothetical protein